MERIIASAYLVKPEFMVNGKIYQTNRKGQSYETIRTAYY